MFSVATIDNTPYINTNRQLHYKEIARLNALGYTGNIKIFKTIGQQGNYLPFWYYVESRIKGKVEKRGIVCIS